MSGVDFDPDKHGFDGFDESLARHAEEMERNREIARAEGNRRLLAELDNLDTEGAYLIEKRRLASSSFIPGISLVNEAEHVVCGQYPRRASDEDGVLVVEVANARLAHTRIKGGHPFGRIAVFARLVSHDEIDARMDDYIYNSKAYIEDHLKSLSS